MELKTDKLERVVKTIRNSSSVIVVMSFLLILICGCASYLKYESKKPLVNKEIEEKFVLQELPAETSAHSEPEKETPPAAEAEPTAVVPEKLDEKEAAKKDQKDKKSKKEVVAPQVVPGPLPVRRRPEIEDDFGFAGRRPIVDPFRVGEKTVLDVSYFGVSAGDMTIEVGPYVAVNGNKSYKFIFRAETSSVFGAFYKVDDWAEAYLDYQQMIPYNYSLHVKETAQIREVRNYFDWSKMRSFFYEKKVTKKWGEEEKKEEWEIAPYSQNVFTGAMYLRAFTFRPGKKYSIPVSHEGKNFVVTAEVVRQESLDTPIGAKNCNVIKMEIKLEGVFQPVGDILFWMTNDSRKFIVRIESKKKIGKIVAMVKELTL